MKTTFLLLSQFDKTLLTLTDVAGIFECSRKTIQNRLAAGTFPVPPVKFGAQVLFRIQDVANYIDSQVRLGADAAKSTNRVPMRF